MRDATAKSLQDPTTFAVPSGTFAHLHGQDDLADVLVANWEIETLLDLGRRLKAADHILTREEALASRAAISDAGAAGRTEDGSLEESANGAVEDRPRQTSATKAVGILDAAPSN